MRPACLAARSNRARRHRVDARRVPRSAADSREFDRCSACARRGHAGAAALPATGSRVIAGRLDGKALGGARFPAVQYFLNAYTEARTRRPARIARRTVGAASGASVAGRGRSARPRGPLRSRDGALHDSCPHGRGLRAARKRGAADCSPPPARALADARTSASTSSCRADYDARERYPVLYLDDGQDLAAVHVRDTLEKLRGEPLAL